MTLPHFRGAGSQSSKDDAPSCTTEACSFSEADHEQQEERTLGKPLHI